MNVENDGELVERAAQAAGITGITGTLADSGDLMYELNGNSYYWNPLKSDGDALRLAISLGINVHTEGDCVYWGKTVVAYNPKDIYAATRRAITEAAALEAPGRKDEGT